MSRFARYPGPAGTTSDSAGADLFKSMDTDGDGTLTKTELADGAKKLFDQLRTQLMTAAGSTTSNTQSADTPPADAAQGAPPANGGHHHHGGGGGMFSKIASLLDQYRSNATDTAATTADASTLSVAA